MKLILAVITLSVCSISANDELWMNLMSANIMGALTEEMETGPREGKDIPTLANDLGLTTLVELVKKADLAGALSGAGPFTLFGPTNKAFQALPPKFVDFLLKNVTVLADILKYHVASGKALSTDLKNDQLVPSLQGKNIRINIYKNGAVITASGRQVTLADQEASNGVIHEVGGVLFPPPGTVTYAVSKCPVFKTLLKAVKIAGLADLLDGEGPFTVFAPDDRAFAKIPSTCLDKLLSNKTLLTAVLKYHVVPGTFYSAGLSCGDKFKTANGQSVHITKIFGRVFVNWSKVTYPDGSVTNGVMHVINRVLLPKMGLTECEDDASFDGEDDKNDMSKKFFSL